MPIHLYNTYPQKQYLSTKILNVQSDKYLNILFKIISALFLFINNFDIELNNLLSLMCKNFRMNLLNLFKNHPKKHSS